MNVIYEELLRETEKEHLEVTYMVLSEKIKGLYCDGIIAINKIISTTSEQTCVLAEELGHYYTSSGNIIDQKDAANRKQEIKAKRWAYKRLVPMKKIYCATKAGCRNAYEVAEFLGVTEEFLIKAIDTYRSVCGISFDLLKIGKNI